MSAATAQQPAPTPGGVDVTADLLATCPRISPQLAADLRARSDMGLAKYGTRLTTRNGRDAVVDLYQEACDAVVYAHQALLEEPDPGREWDPYSRRDLLRSLRNEAIGMAETIRRRLVTR